MSESEERFRSSARIFRGGHGGASFRSFCDNSHECFIPFFGETNHELISTYKHHSYLHFLRMLSYGENPEISSIVLQHLNSINQISVLDVGCGLAQLSRQLCRTFGVHRSTLHLLDIPSMRKEYLHWACDREKIMMHFINSETIRPPALSGDFNVIIVTEFFEHVSDPVLWFDEIFKVAQDKAIMVTNVANHKTEFMHISPNLETLRRHMYENGCEEIKPYQVFRINK